MIPVTSGLGGTAELDAAKADIGEEILLNGAMRSSMTDALNFA